MKDPQKLTIVLLLITAVALSAMLVSAYRTRDNAAYAESAIKGGDYLMADGAFTTSVDVVYVLDIGARQLNVYSTNINTDTLDLIDSVDLGRAFAD